MCKCTEFLIQVLKQKNAHVSFPVGMVSLISPEDFFVVSPFFARKQAPKNLLCKVFFGQISPNHDFVLLKSFFVIIMAAVVSAGGFTKLAKEELLQIMSPSPLCHLERWLAQANTGTPVETEWESWAMLYSDGLGIRNAKAFDSCKLIVQFGNPQAICTNQAIRANLPIDLRESSHRGSGANHRPHQDGPIPIHRALGLL